MTACGRFSTPPLSRRDMLRQCAMGFGGFALAALNASPLGAIETPPGHASASLAPHFPARARHVIFLYMDGGPSQVDTFDPKPRLIKEAGKPFGMKMEPTQFNNVGTTFPSPWKFRHYGQSGLEVSDLFPHVAATSADRLCVIRSMTSKFSEHTNANYFLHTGLGLSGRPSVGAWVSYGLGSENQNLPAFVVLNGGLVPPGGLDCFASGFLPATHQGSIFLPQDRPVANIEPRESERARQHRKLELMRRLDAGFSREAQQDDAIESAIANHELAFRMQAEVPELYDLSGESSALKQRYGFEAPFTGTQTFARQCLLARRMVERGVRFIELTCPALPGNDRWDQHANLERSHASNALAVDQPIAALLDDLDSRGLLEETVVLWGGEFGRTPFAQGSNGRDHNPFGFTMWLAGAGVRPGIVYGATDEYGYKVVENKVEIHDLHATLLHLLGFDHTKLTLLHGGREMRLTDVHGEVLHDILL